MTTLIAAVLFLLAMAVALALLKQRARAPSGDWPYYARKPLSAAEQVLYWRLSEALPDHVVLAQVALSRLLGVKKGYKFYTWHNRISQMSADFAICSKDCAIVAVVELDDSSHDMPRRKRADATKDKALSAAGIRVLRWRAKEVPDAAEIKARLAGPQAAPDAVAASSAL